MILNARNKRPKISFGLGVTEISASSEVTVKVWLDNIFSENEYQFDLVGVEAIEITPYEWEISGLEKGSYTIEMEISSKEIKPKAKAIPLPKASVLKSNRITLTVL